MSIVTVQIGQAGNQIGCELFDSLSKSPEFAHDPYAFERFFEPPRIHVGGKPEALPRARSVMVDMEQKVVANSLDLARKSGRWVYRSGMQHCQKRGAGNNWADGYINMGEEELELCVEMVKKEAELCDDLGGLLLLQSVAGGTGSGVGARVTEALRDHFPSSGILNHVVWPYASGEVIVQNYNSLLSMSHLVQVSNGVIVVQNDQIHKICATMLNLKIVSFSDMNKIIASNLVGILLPSIRHTSAFTSSFSSEMNMNDILSHTCPHPSYKLLSLRGVPQMPSSHQAYTNYLWKPLLSTLRQMQITESYTEMGLNWKMKEVDVRVGACYSNLLLLRGKDLHEVDPSPFKSKLLYSACSPSPLDVWSNSSPLGGHEKSAFLLSNTNAIAPSMERIVSQAWKMYSSRAYVHQYLKHGLTEDDFVSSFVKCEQMIKDYSELR